VTGAPDVAVIGGGIVGTSAAMYLARAGASVTLYERQSIAAGASGRNSGVVQHPFDPVLADLHRGALALYRELAAEAGTTFRMPSEPAGLLYVAADEDRVARLADALRHGHAELGPVFLPPAQARRLEPGLAIDVAACRLAIGYPVAPAAAALAFADLARRAGARVEVGSAARPWIEGGHLHGVEVAGREVPARAVVVAAGPWTPKLIDPSGRWRPIEATWGVVVDIRLHRPPRHVLEELDVEAAIEPSSGEAAGIAFSLVPGERGSTLGSTFLARQPDPVRLLPALRTRGAAFVPAIATAPRGEHRACARPVSADGHPLVGELSWLRGLFMAAGHGPWGISTGPASGRMIADLVLGRIEAPPPALDPGRFGRPESP
jgi:glycine/D-amino acid oxidase-like deaminating enzyme